MQKTIEVKQISDTEFLVGKNLTSLINENIIEVIVVGVQTNEQAEVQKEINKKLASKTNGKVCYLIDLNKSGKNEPKARAMWNAMCEPEEIEKAAVFGLHPVAKVLAAFVIGVSRTKKQRFFNTRDEAMKWLLNE